MFQISFIILPYHVVFLKISIHLKRLENKEENHGKVLPYIFSPIERFMSLLRHKNFGEINVFKFGITFACIMEI
jgi:hypothetical protein